MSIYIILGRLKNDDEGQVDVIKAFTQQEKAEIYIQKQYINLDKDECYSSFYWMITELE